MELVLEGNKETLQIRVIGELIADTCSDLREMVMDASARQPKAVLLDMSETPFLDTSGLGVLVGLRQHLRHQGTVLSLVNPSPKVLDVLRMTRLLKVFGLGDNSHYPS
ncbi:MAG: STAS domain-containing protein [Sumerlaeia bacterium]